METCRICLRTGPDNLSIHKSGSDQKYTFCTHLQIDPNDDLPQGICLVCYNTLDHFFYFKQMSNHSNATLLSKLNEPSSIQYICDHCHKSFAKKYKLASHMSTHKTKPDVMCKVCYKMFKSYQRLREHMFVHSKSHKSAFKCEHCDRSFTRKPSLISHLDCHKTVADLKCEICNKSFKSKKYFKKHQNLHVSDVHRKNTFKCDHCSRLFFKKGSLVLHMESHGDTANHKCNVCHKMYRSRHTLKVHSLGHLPSDSDAGLKCTFCPKTFYRKNALFQHMDTHKQIPDIKCDVCDKLFKCRDYLRRHMLTHLPGDSKKQLLDKTRPFRCDHCPKKFSKQYFLNRHQNWHKNNNNLACDVCLKKFRTRRYLKKHCLKHHLDESKTQVKCEDLDETKDCLKSDVKDIVLKCSHCTKTFRKFETFSRHLDTHKQVKCQVCDKMFKSKELLKRHSIVHLPVEERYIFKCHQCFMSFPRKPTLVKHLPVCKRITFAKCQTCDKIFKSNQFLELHSKVHINEKKFTLK